MLMDEKEYYSLTPCDSGKTANESLYPMYYGVSCAFFALQILSKPDFEDAKWSGMRDNILQGSAQLLALLVWKSQRGTSGGGDCEMTQKLKCAEREIEVLKTLRHEDAKANEKVVSIFATQEQSWLIEKKKLRLQIGALMNQLRIFEKQKDEVVSKLNERLKELELLVQTKHNGLEEEVHKRKELEEKLNKAETDVEKLRESVKLEAQDHASEIRKHKTAFIELVSNQRQLEAEFGRSLKQAEATKHELESVIKQKEETEVMAQKLSTEMVKMHNDLEQKDKILSALLRKSKVDLEEKQMLLKEVKLSKVKRKQAELESEKWRTVSESRYERHSFKTILANNIRSKMNVLHGTRGIHSYSTGSSHTEKEQDDISPPLNHCIQELNEDLGIMTNFKRLGGWVRSEAEKYANMIEQRHHLELDAFAEQMRLKDEKLEELQWKMLSMELESKRMQSHIEGLSNNVSHLRHENMKLHALLLEREDEVSSLKEQLPSPECNKNNASSTLYCPEQANETIWQKVKFMKSKPMEEELEASKSLLEEDSEGGEQEHKHKEYPCSNQLQSRKLTVQSPEKEFEEQAVVLDVSSHKDSSSQGEVNTARNTSSPHEPIKQTENPPWRMDLNAIGVSYKIKRLKQQLIMLERLIGKQDSAGQDVGSSNEETVGIKCLLSLISLLNKQVGRYQSLQEKTDDLCKRMHGNDDYARRDVPSDTKTKEKTKTLEHFLEETFQVQRYIVATGQKLMETQTKITSGFTGFAQELEKTAGIDMKRFADSISALFQQVQRGLEIRIARIIGDLEGTLACEGMTRLRR